MDFDPFTNNGDTVNDILHAEDNHEKEYLVSVNKPGTDTYLDGMAGACTCSTPWPCRAR
jgi:23S rRNA pseudouridine2604 synthase